jgi:hypothetical protein
MSQRKTLSKPYACQKPSMDRNCCLIVFLLYICHTVIHRKLQNVVYMQKKLMLKKKEGWAIRSTIRSCPQVPVILKSVSDPMLCATFTYSIMSTGGH